MDYKLYWSQLLVIPDAVDAVDVGAVAVFYLEQLPFSVQDLQRMLDGLVDSSTHLYYLAMGPSPYTFGKTGSQTFKPPTTRDDCQRSMYVIRVYHGFQRQGTVLICNGW